MISIAYGARLQPQRLDHPRPPPEPVFQNGEMRRDVNQGIRESGSRYVFMPRLDTEEFSGRSALDRKSYWR